MINCSAGERGAAPRIVMIPNWNTRNPTTIARNNQNLFMMTPPFERYVSILC